MKTLVHLLVSVLFITISTFSYAQVAISDDASYTPNSSALLDIHSQNGDMGILIPQVTLTGTTDNTTISSPANGLLVFHTGTAAMQEGYYFWSSGDGEWKLLYSGTVPTVPGNTVYWVRPTGMPYIQPEGNDYIHIYDSGETYGIYYDGATNQYGVWSQTGNSTNPTAAVVGFSNVSGNQTYGYLGYNGTYNSGTGFGSLDGMAVYGMVDDPGRAAGFFRTTNNATVAANIAYSDVWIASFNFVNDARDTYTPLAVYGQLDVTVANQAAYSGFEVGVKGVSVFYPNSTNGAYTIGVYGYGGGNDKDGDGYLDPGYQTSFGVYGSGVSEDHLGIGVYGYGYSASTTDIGVYGYAATIGVYGSGGTYGIYSSTGGGFKGNKFGIASFARGDLFGSLIKGDEYGAHIKGNQYAAYFDGIQYSNNVSIQLIDNGTSQRKATYVPVSESADIIIKGQAKLNSGKAEIIFDKNIASIISEKNPIYITVTPTSETKGLYIASTKNTGFVVRENNNGKSNATFNWIAIATRKDAENISLDKAVLANDYDEKFDGVYRDINNEANPPTEMMWNGKELIFGKIPANLKPPKEQYLKQIKAEKTHK